MASSAVITRISAAVLIGLAVSRFLSMDAVADVRHQPGDSRAWFELASREESVAAYERSLETGRFVPGLMNERLVLGVALWPRLDERERAMTAEQAVLLWRHDREDFLRLARLPAFKRALQDMLAQFYPQEISWFIKRRDQK